jgi:osmotically inducible lipoprotein OsmB
VRAGLNQTATAPLISPTLCLIRHCGRFYEDFAMAEDKNPTEQKKMAEYENPTVQKNKYLFGGVGAVLGGLTGVAIGGPLIAVVGAGLGGLLGYNMLKRL